MQQPGSVWPGLCGRARCRDGRMLSRELGLAEPFAAVAVSVRGSAGAGAMWLLRSRSSETHFLFLGSDKCRWRSPARLPRQRGSVSDTRWQQRFPSRVPWKQSSKAQPKPAVRRLHSTAFICATSVAGSAQPLGCKGLEYEGCPCHLGQEAAGTFIVFAERR